MKYIKEFTSHFGKRESFSIRDARVFLKNKGISNGYLHFLVHYLLKRGDLKRLGRGCYTFQEDPIVSGFAFSPFYYGLHQALSLHGLWGQATNPVVVTTRKVRPGVRAILGANVVVRRISPKMFFGFEQVNHFGHWIPVSGPEKTLIDFVYFRQKIPEEAKKGLVGKADQKELGKMLRKAPPWVKKRMRKLIQ